MGTRILVVDDEPQMQHLLRSALERRSYEVRLADDGETALDIVASSWPQLIILDLSLPGLDGLEVCRRIRAWTPVPIIVLSARQGDHDKVEALDLGADDYLTKPFSMDELLARLRVAFRHSLLLQEAVAIHRFGELTVDLSRRQVLRNDAEVHLTPTEYDLLRLFITNTDRVLTQRQILREVWGPGYENDLGTLRVFIAQLRQKVEPEPSQPSLILTEPGVGYRFHGERTS